MKKVILATVLASALSAQALASTGQVQVGAVSVLRSYDSAAAYQAAVDDAVNAAGAKTTAVSSFESLAFSSVKPSSLAGNYAMKTTITFGVTEANSGVWSFRAGVDFGKGGALFLDNTALTFNSGDMWWNGSYSGSGSFKVTTTNPLAAGNHTLTLYGIEGCCSGNQQIQFSAPGSTSFKSFSSTDGLAVAAVPEPETYAMLVAGLGLMGAVARRRKAAQKA